jgi:hypothetical protein
LDWIVHHDSAPGHKALSVKQFLAQKSITEMGHPPCSPSFALNDFWLFPKNKGYLKGVKIQKIDIQRSVTMKVVPQQEFQKRFQQWQHHWTKCIAAQGDCFEGDLSEKAVSISIQECLQ